MLLLNDGTDCIWALSLVPDDQVPRKTDGWKLQGSRFWFNIKKKNFVKKNRKDYHFFPRMVMSCLYNSNSNGISYTLTMFPCTVLKVPHTLFQWISKIPNEWPICIQVMKMRWVRLIYWPKVTQLESGAPDFAYLLWGSSSYASVLNC